MFIKSEAFLKKSKDCLKPYYLALIIGVISLLANSLFLDRTPPVTFDEVGYASPAYELLFHGKLATKVFKGFMKLEDYTFWQPPLYFVVLSLVYKFFGFGMIQTRMVGIFFYGVCVVLIFLISMQMFRDIKIAILGAILLALDPIFVQYSRHGRMDTLSIGLALIAVYLYLLHVIRRQYTEGSVRSMRMLAIAGLCMGLAILAHPLGVMTFIGLSVAIYLDYYYVGRRFLNLLSFWFAITIVLLFWFIYILHNPSLFIKQFFWHVSQHTNRLGPIQALFAEINDRYIEGYNRYPFVFISAMIGLYLIIFDQNRIDRPHKKLFLTLVLVDMVFLAVVVLKVPWFLPYIAPWFSMAGSFFLVRFWEITKHSRRKTIRALYYSWIFLVGVNLLLTGLPARYAVALIQWDGRDVFRFNQEIGKYIPPGSEVLGPYTLWYGLIASGSNLYSLEMYGNTHLPLQDFDYIILPGPLDHLSSYIYKPLDPELAGFYNDLSRIFKTHLEQHCFLLGKIELPLRPLPGVSINPYRAIIYKCGETAY